MFSALLVGTTLLVTGQDPAVLERRLTQLDALRRQAGMALTRVDSVRQERLDTIRAGALVVLVRPQHADLVRRGVEMAWWQLDSLYGDAAAILATRPLLFWFQERGGRPIPPQVTSVEAVLGDSASTRVDIARQVVVGAARILREKTDTALANWLGPLLLPATQSTAEAARIYVELVTAPSAAVRRCYQGNAASCSAALGLVDGGDRVTLWFDVSERRALVSRMTPMERASRRSAAEACLLAQSDEDCIAVLHTLTYLDAPLSTEARHSFARATLAAGGRGAYRRLVRSAGRPLSERLAIAARAAPDSIALHWRAAIMAGRPKTVTLASASGWMALGWMLVFGLLALRSTRWR